MTIECTKQLKDTGSYTPTTRQLITRQLVLKMITVYGDYPTTEKKLVVAKYLSEIFGLSHKIFFDSIMHSGFLIRCLENVRKRWESKHFCSS